MNPKTLATILALCISVLIIAVVVRTEMLVFETLLPLYEREAMHVVME